MEVAPYLDDIFLIIAILAAFLFFCFIARFFHKLYKNGMDTADDNEQRLEILAHVLYEFSITFAYYNPCVKRWTDEDFNEWFSRQAMNDTSMELE